MFLFSKKKKEKFSDECELTQKPSYQVSIQQFEIKTSQDAPFKLGKIHEVGKRKNQQDTLAYSEVADEAFLEEKGALFIVADGMGGLSDGAEVSSLLAVKMLQFFDANDFTDSPSEKLYEMVMNANEEINLHLGESRIGKSGSTLVTAYIKDDKVYWLSIGDSNIYLYRNHSIIRVNELHNYEKELMEMVSEGVISMEQAMSHPDRAALTSYVGAGELKYVDRNPEPLILEKEDRLLLTSDGLDTVTKEELEQMMHYDAAEAALKLKYLISEKNKRNQDNYTAIIIEAV